MQRLKGIVGIVAAGVAMTIGLAAQDPAAPPAAARGGFQQQPPKNLKVLPKTWTGQQVRAVMQTFTESLGVQCAHCHAVDPTAPPPPEGRPPTLDYASDEKKEKGIARQMIQMTMALNADALKDVGDPAVPEKVSCLTCHNGQKTPLNKPAAGWGRGNFSLLPAGPTVPQRRGGGGV
jgi:mono/diheme cytochrome c family protein